MDLAGDEELLLQEHPSWRSIVGFYIVGAVAAAAALVATALLTNVIGDETNWPIAVAVGVGILVVVLLVGFVKRVGSTYSVTTRRVNVTHGIVARKSQESRVGRIQSTTTQQSFLGRILGVGDVVLDSAASEEDEIRFIGVRDPQRVSRAIDRLLAGHDASSDV